MDSRRLDRNDVVKLVRDLDVKMLRLQFTDILGGLKNIGIPGQHIEAVLATSGLPPGATARVQAAMAAPELVPIDHGRFSANPAQALLLMLDLIALARRDGHVRPSERAYLRNVGKEIGYPEEDVVALTGG